MNRKSEHSTEFVTNTAKYQHSQKQARGRTNSLGTESIKAQTYAQSISNLNSNTPTSLSVKSDINGPTNPKDINTLNNGSETFVPEMNNNLNILNKTDSPVQLPLVDSIPVPIPGIQFGKSDLKSFDQQRNSGVKSSQVLTSGGVPFVLPKVDVKPSFGNSKNAIKLNVEPNDTEYDGIGPVPLPSNNKIQNDNLTRTQNHNISSEDNTINNKETRESGNINFKNQTKTSFSSYQHNSHPKQPRMSFPVPDETSHKRIPSSNIVPPMYPNRQLQSETHNEVPIHTGIAPQSPYMTSATPLSSTSTNPISSHNRDNSAGGFHIPGQHLEQPQFGGYQPQVPPHQSNINNRGQPSANVHNGVGMPYIHINPQTMPHAREKQPNISSIPGASGNQNVIQYSMPAPAHNVPHIISPMQMPHNNMPTQMQNNSQPPMGSIGQPMQHWNPGNYYPTGPIGSVPFDSQYYHSGPPNFHQQHPQHMGFVQQASYMMPRVGGGHSMQQNIVLGNPAPDAIPIPGITAQQSTSIGSTPPSGVSHTSTMKFNLNSVEFTPKAKSSRIPIVNPNTKKEVEIPSSNSNTSLYIPHQQKDASFIPPESILSKTQSNGVSLDDSKSQNKEIKKDFVLPPASKAIKIVNPSLANTAIKKPKYTPEPEAPKKDITPVDEIKSISSQPNITISEKEPVQLEKVEKVAEKIPNVDVNVKTQSTEPEIVKPEEPVLIIVENTDSVTEEKATKPSEQVDSIESVTSKLSDLDIKVESIESKPAEVVQATKDTSPAPTEPEKLPETPEATNVVPKTTSVIADIDDDEKKLAEKNETNRILSEILTEEIKSKTSEPNEVKKTVTENQSEQLIKLRDLTVEEMSKLDIYPPSVKNYLPALRNGTIIYPSEFLLSFRSVCLKKPEYAFESVLAEDRSTTSKDRRGGMGKDRSGGRSQILNTLGDMNSFKSTPRTSEERFRASTMQGGLNVSRSVSGLGGRTPSTGNRASRGSKTSRGYRGGRGGQQGDQNQPSSPLITNYEPLVQTENRWKPKLDAPFDEDKVIRGIASDIPDEIVERKVKILLNKLTVDNFAKVSPEIIGWANRSVEEEDGRIICIVLQLIFEKATDEPTFAAMYAKLSRNIYDSVDPKLTINIADREGKPTSGFMVVRKILLNRCQREFESGWKVEIPDDIKSDEYYKAMKIKRRGLGLVKFVGELFLLNIISERLLRMCITNLLEGDNEEETLESLSKLLTTVGARIDNGPGVEFLNNVCEKLKALTNSKKVNSRIRFMLMDVIDLRLNKWVSRAKETGPKTIAAIHAEAEKQKIAQSLLLRRGMSSSGRGPNVNQSGGGRGGPRSGDRSSYGGRQNMRNEREPNRNAGDLSNFGDLSRSKAHTSGSLGPGGNPFGNLGQGSRGWKNTNNDSRGRKDDMRSGRNQMGLSINSANSGGTTRKTTMPAGGKQKQEKITSANIFNALLSDDDDIHVPLSPNVEIISSQIQESDKATTESEPQSKPVSNTSTDVMPKAIIHRKTRGIVDEYLGILDKNEFVECLRELGEANYGSFLSELVEYMLDHKATEVVSISEVLKHTCSLSILSESQIISGFSAVGNSLADISTDAPFAPKHFATLLAATDIKPLRLVDCMGEFIQQNNSLSPPTFKVACAYLTAMSEFNDVEFVISALSYEENGKKFDVTQFLPEDKRDTNTVKTMLDRSSVLQFFPELQE
ncbi:hypothetical protein BB558_000593 [Smittium angustum]|uniref:MI domain-containing protein n=1 Tax=Smittium angustum TaxID=133377 RepID=A0A2U1JDU1_SMIAN|nr:hypothetical protein BB558_000593 [Smittium angustum]